METIYLFDSIIEYLFVSSAMLFMLGILSSLVFSILRIKGDTKLWICSLLVILPLVYPIKTFVPEPVKVPVPQKIYQSFAFQQVNTIFDENHSPKAVSGLTNDALSAGNTANAAVLQRNEEDIRLTNQPIQAVSKISFDWKLIAALTWSFLFLYFLFRLIAITYNMNRLLKHANPVKHPSIIKLYNQCAAETGMHRTPKLLMLDGIHAPMVMGFLKPVILLPGHLLKPEFREGLRFALLHELKHARQHHNRWLLIESVIGAAYFFHPVFHWAKKKIHEELEHICDRHVVSITNKSASYADFLLHEIWQKNCERSPALALPFISGVTRTANRIRSILENSRPSMFAQIRGKVALGFIFLSFLTFLLCSIAPAPRDPGKAPGNPVLPPIESPDNVIFQALPAEMEKEPVKKLKTERIIPDKDLQALAAIEKSSPDDNRDIFPTVVNVTESENSIKEVDIILREESTGIQAAGKEQRSRDMTDAMIQAEKTSETQTIPGSIYPADENILISADKNNIVSGEEDLSEKIASHETNASKTKAEKYLGDPVDGLSLHHMDNIKIINSQTVLFIMRNDDLYLTRLSEPCLGLLYTNTFKFDSLAGNLTKFDRIHAILNDRVMDTSGMLGEFYPYHYEGSIADAIKFLKKSLLEELVAEGPFGNNFQKG